jgi:hypothetical protein
MLRMYTIDSVDDLVAKSAHLRIKLVFVLSHLLLTVLEHFSFLGCGRRQTPLAMSNAQGDFFLRFGEQFSHRLPILVRVAYFLRHEAQFLINRLLHQLLNLGQRLHNQLVYIIRHKIRLHI